MSTMTEYGWAKELLTKMGYEVNENNVTSILAWEYAEGGHFHNDAKFNPLNTTRDSEKWGGKYDSINSHGVASYPDRETGIDKTVETLKLDAYDKVRHNLENSASPKTTLNSVVASPWGTTAISPGLISRANTEADKHDLPKGGSDDGKGDGKGGKDDDKGGKGNDSGGKGGKGNDDKGGKGASKKVVLDLPELKRLNRTYETATDEIQRHRRVVGDIAAALEPARAALTDRGLATVIKATFDWLLEPGGGFDDDARQHDALAALTGDIHRLATEADADHNGKWSRGESMAFASKHKGADGDALGAVMAALSGGSILAKSPKAGADAGGKGGGKGGAGSDKGGSGGSGGSGEKGSRAQRVEKMLDLAAKQRANDGGGNHTKYGKWYGQDGQAWCAQFVSWVFAHSGNPLPAMQSAKGFAHCSFAIDYARKHNQLHSTPRVGDIFLRKDAEHTGIVSKVNPDGTFETIEGNAGPKTDRVVHGTRDSKDGIYHFWTAVRP